MILDWKSDFKFADQHEICDANWQPLPMVPPYCDIFYADDQRGILRYHTRDSKGQFEIAFENDPSAPIGDLFCKFDRNGIDATPPICACWREMKLPIRIVKKSTNPGA